MQNKNLLYWHNKPNEPTKKGPLSFAFFESLFTSVSTVSRGHPSLVSLSPTKRFEFERSIEDGPKSIKQIVYFTYRAYSLGLFWRRPVVPKV
jgi:hypothetical protein